jgi:hypothetical protein
MRTDCQAFARWGGHLRGRLRRGIGFKFSHQAEPLDPVEQNGGENLELPRSVEVADEVWSAVNYPANRRGLSQY